MKKIETLFLILAVLTLSFNYESTLQDSKNKGINFSDLSFEDALKEAKSSNKLVFLDAYAAWCGPCKWMEANTFKDKKVGDYFNENYINLKIDMEKGEGPAIANKYKVTAYPTMFFINGDGEVVERILGAKPADEFLQKAKTIQ